MEPTYSISEIKALLPLLDLPQVLLLEEVCKEEADCYRQEENEAIQKMVVLTKNNLSVNELQLEYLLSFN